MSDFLNGFFIARAARLRTMRIMLLVFLAGALVAGFIYVFVVLKAVSERNNTPHVQPHSTH